MLKVLYFCCFDVLFVYISALLWKETNGEINGYLIFCIAAVAFFTWELIRSFKEWINK